MIVSGVLTYAAVAALPAAAARGPLLLMAVLYPAGALLVQRRFGSGWLPTTAAGALVPFAASVAAALPALPGHFPVAALFTTLALLQLALPVGLATAAIWRLDGRAARPLQLAGGIVAYLCAIPLATAATATALLAMVR